MIVTELRTMTIDEIREQYPTREIPSRSSRYRGWHSTKVRSTMPAGCGSIPGEFVTPLRAEGRTQAIARDQRARQLRWRALPSRPTFARRQSHRAFLAQLGPR